MSFWDLLQIAITWAGIVTAALALGEAALRGSDRLVRRFQAATPAASAPSMTRFALALLVGMGAVGYVGVVLGVAHVFHWATLLAAGVAACVLGRNGLGMHLRWLRAAPREGLAELRANAPAAVLVAIAGVAYVMVGLTALAPPTAADALSYHLPEALVVVDTHHLPWTVGSSDFFGNLPVLGEMQYAVGLAFADLQISQVLHWTLFGGFLLALAGLLRDLYGLTTAALAVAAVATFMELTWNATTPMIDAMVIGFEVTGLVCAAAWASTRRVELAGAAALLLGLALACKYTPAPTAVFVTAIALVLLYRLPDRGTAIRLGGALALLGALAGGYWYVKNLIHTGNPVHPFLLGSNALTEAEIDGAIGQVRGHSGGLSDFGEFLRTPKEYLNPVALPEFLAFFAWPFALLVKRSATATRLLALYFVLYVPYWFFFATHEERFLMSALVVGVILLAIPVAAVADRMPTRVVLAAGAACVAVLAVSVVRFGPDEAAKAVTKPPAFPGYFTGATSADDLLVERFGCDYAALAHAEQLPAGAILNDWTAGAGTSLKIYADDDHPLVILSYDPDPRPVRERAAEADVRYAFVNEDHRRWLMESDNPEHARRARAAVANERALGAGARVIWQDGPCRLYALAG